MRASESQRKVTCALARKQIAFARDCAAVHAQKKTMPDGVFIAIWAGETLGLQEALQALSPGRHRHYVEVAERMVRRKLRRTIKQPVVELEKGKVAP